MREAYFSGYRMTRYDFSAGWGSREIHRWRASRLGVSASGGPNRALKWGLRGPGDGARNGWK